MILALLGWAQMAGNAKITDISQFFPVPYAWCCLVLVMEEYGAKRNLGVCYGKKTLN